MTKYGHKPKIKTFLKNTGNNIFQDVDYENKAKSLKEGRYGIPVYNWCVKNTHFY